MPVARTFTVNPALTGFALGYKNPDVSFIADEALPRVPVPAERFKWLEYPLAEAFTVPDTKVSRKGRPAEVEFSAIERDGSVETYGLQDPIPQSDIDSAAAQRAAGLSTYDPMMRATAMLTHLMAVDREVRVASLYSSTANYDAARVFTLATATTRFDDYVNSDPITTIMNAIDSVLIYRPNTCAMSETVWSKLRRHPKLVKAIRNSYSGEGQITRQEFSDFFEIPRFLVGQGYVNTARKGQTASISRIWGKNVSFTYIDRAAGPDGGMTWGFTPTFGGRIAGTLFDQDIGLKGGEVLRVGEQLNELVVAKAAGALIVSAIS